MIFQTGNRLIENLKIFQANGGELHKDKSHRHRRVHKLEMKLISISIRILRILKKLEKLKKLEISIKEQILYYPNVKSQLNKIQTLWNTKTTNIKILQIMKVEDIQFFL